MRCKTLQFAVEGRTVDAEDACRLLAVSIHRTEYIFDMASFHLVQADQAAGARVLRAFDFEPKVVDGTIQTPIEGVSMVYSFDQPAAKST